MGMTDEEIREKLKAIFAVVLELEAAEEITRARRIAAKKWDSLAQVSLIAGIESEFGVRLESRDHERMTSFAATELLLIEKCR
jgi:acyl carrier protein